MKFWAHTIGALQALLGYDLVNLGQSENSHDNENHNYIKSILTLFLIT